jgi:crossover junction endodeoxyribonuclease RuvC
VRIIGIDPGTLVTGYGIVDKDGGRISFVACGCVRNRPAASLPDRFLNIYRELGGVFDAYRPGEMALEGIFFCKNVKTALKLGEARGVAMLVAAEKGVEVFEFAPRRVKQAVLGRGDARKSQVQFMMRSLLGLDEVPSPPDAADALAIALCRAFSGGDPRSRISDLKSGQGERAQPTRGRVKG